MRRRVWKLMAALIIGCLGACTPRAMAQDGKPAASVIDVWGVSGKPFGTIRIAQPILHNVLSHGLVAEFVPNDNKQLKDLAATLWPGADPKCLHFNWIQITTDSGNPPTPLDAAGQPLFSPFLDPPAGGYQVIEATEGADPNSKQKNIADNLPWFLDETPYTPQKSADMNIHNPNITLADILRWYAKPYSANLPDELRYDTILVLINDCASQYEPLGGFHWTASFPQTGDPRFSVTPFGPKERFEYGKLIADFGKKSSAKQKARVWTIRPLVKP